MSEQDDKELMPVFGLIATAAALGGVAVGAVAYHVWAGDPDLSAAGSPPMVFVVGNGLVFALFLFFWCAGKPLFVKKWEASLAGWIDRRWPSTPSSH